MKTDNQKSGRTTGRKTSAAAKNGDTFKKLRVMVLCHEDLVPPDSVDGLTPKEIAPYKTEWDVISTFAVWLQPRSNWRRRYRGWPALRKLEYVDELVGDIAGTRPRNRVRRKIETLPDIRITLREHYDRKREKYAFEWPAYLDNDLRRIFSAEPRRRTRETAAAFLRRVAPEIQQLVSEGTGVHGYAIDHVLELMVARAAQLKLRVVGREEILKRHLMVMLTVQTMNVVHSGYYRIAL